MKKLIFLQILVVGLIISCTYAGNKLDNEVLKAYELRMEGKVDAAAALLDSILAVDENHAMANFEMARLKSYMFTGGGEVEIADILVYAQKAADADPGNAYYAYYNATAHFLNAYYLMQTGGEELNEAISKACKLYENVVEIDPRYGEALLSLVEVYGFLPEDMGGDRTKAEEYAQKLTDVDGYLAAKAKVTLAPDDLDLVKYWTDLLALNGDDPDYMKEVAFAYMFTGDIENAEKYLRKVMELDPNQNTQLLNLSRYHMYNVMQNRDLMAEELPIAKTFAEEYLNTEPVVPMKAYCLGMISRFDRFLGNQEAAEKAMQEATTLDPYFSRASGLHSMALFSPPDKEYRGYSSFFSPF